MKPRIQAIVYRHGGLFRPHRIPFLPPRPVGLLSQVFLALQKRGYATSDTFDLTGPVDADIAIQHVDVTHTPDEYTRFCSRFPFCLNLAVTDISKSRISEARVFAGDDWAGPVIVKTDLNTQGKPEAKRNRRAAMDGLPPPFPNAAPPRDYVVYDTLGEVPADVWSDPALVVDRFMSEQVSDGFAMCHYVFCGEYEYCGRFVGTEKLVKSRNIFRNEIIPVPERMRDLRKQLGFDFGKFDFVHYEGRHYLLDANKTPGRVPRTGGASIEGLADGFVSLIERL